MGEGTNATLQEGLLIIWAPYPMQCLIGHCSCLSAPSGHGVYALDAGRTYTSHIQWVCSFTCRPPCRPTPFALPPPLPRSLFQANSCKPRDRFAGKGRCTAAARPAVPPPPNPFSSSPSPPPFNVPGQQLRTQRSLCWRRAMHSCGAPCSPARVSGSCCLSRRRARRTRSSDTATTCSRSTGEEQRRRAVCSQILDGRRAFT